MRLTNHVSFTKTDQYSSGVEITIIIPNGRTVSALRRTLLPLLPVNTAVIQLIVARYMGHELDYSQTSELKVNLDIPMKIVYSKFKEPPCMRNAALDIVVSGHVLFLDDDVIPDPSLLKNAVDLIVKDPMTVYKKTSISEVAKLMKLHDYGQMPVRGSQDELIGMLYDVDILIALIGSKNE